MAEQFYLLVESPMAPQTAFDTTYLTVEPMRVGKAPLCPTCGKPTGSLPWLPPHRVEIEARGKAFGDLAFGAGGFIASERFVSLWQSAGLRGLTGFEPIEIVQVRRAASIKGDPPRYYHVGVTRSRAAIDDAASNVVREGEVCRDCRLGRLLRQVRGIVLEAFPVPQDDLFEVRGLSGAILASERFRIFCNTEGLRNAILIPAQDHRFGPYPSFAA